MRKFSFSFVREGSFRMRQQKKADFVLNTQFRIRRRENEGIDPGAQGRTPHWPSGPARLEHATARQPAREKTDQVFLYKTSGENSSLDHPFYSTAEAGIAKFRLRIYWHSLKGPIPLAVCPRVHSPI